MREEKENEGKREEAKKKGEEKERKSLTPESSTPEEEKSAVAIAGACLPVRGRRAGLIVATL